MQLNPQELTIINTGLAFCKYEDKPELIEDDARKMGIQGYRNKMEAMAMICQTLLREGGINDSFEDSAAKRFDKTLTFNQRLEDLKLKLGHLLPHTKSAPQDELDARKVLQTMLGQCAEALKSRTMKASQLKLLIVTLKDRSRTSLDQLWKIINMPSVVHHNVLWGKIISQMSPVASKTTPSDTSQPV